MLRVSESERCFCGIAWCFLSVRKRRSTTRDMLVLSAEKVSELHKLNPQILYMLEGEELSPRGCIIHWLLAWLCTAGVQLKGSETGLRKWFKD